MISEIVHGPVVCVKSDMTKITTILPKNINDESFIRVKLKRKLMYKGHHLFQSVSPRKIYGASDYFKVANPYFEGMFVRQV